jgi:glutamate:GABA antiporter
MVESRDLKKLGIFVLAMINVAAVLGLRNLPSMAVDGWSSVGWYIVGTIVFLVPLGYIGVELSTTFQKGGGLYGWVREAFGEGSGFLAIFFEWSNNLVWYPAALAFIATTLAFAVSPGLADNKVYMFTVAMAVFWGSTLVSLFGDRASNFLGTFGVIAGTIVPASLLCLLGLLFFGGGKSMIGPPTLGAMVPHLSWATIAFAGNAVLLFQGMEMIGFHAGNVKNPSRDLPGGMLVSAVIIFALSVVGTLAIAWVIPEKEISLNGGIMQAFQAILDHFNLAWLVAPAAILIAVGVIATMQAWLSGPARGLRISVDHGFMPPMFARNNKHGAPAGVLLLQAVIGSVIACFYLLAPSVQSAYWILSSIMTEVVCIMYVLIFASFVKLRYSQPDVERPFRVPGGMAGAWILGGVGAGACAFTFFVSLVPTPQSQIGTTFDYVAIMLVGTAVLVVPGLAFVWRRRVKMARAAAAKPAATARIDLAS